MIEKFHTRGFTFYVLFVVIRGDDAAMVSLLCRYACARQHYRHISGQPALFNRHYTTEGPLLLRHNSLCLLLGALLLLLLLFLLLLLLLLLLFLLLLLPHLLVVAATTRSTS